MSPIRVIKCRAGLQPLDSHQPANKSHLLATLNIQRQDTFPWHTATQQSGTLPRAVGRTEVSYEVWPADKEHSESRGPRRGQAPAVAVGVWQAGFGRCLILLRVRSHEQGHLSQPGGPCAGADGVHQGLPGVHRVAEGA